MNAELDDVRRKVWIGNRALHRLGLATGITAGLGHCSMRLPSDPDRFMVKGREMEVDALAVLRQDDIITCNLDGFLVDGKPGLTQVSEVMIHACIYKLRPDVHSIVHVHPRFTVLLSTLNVDMTPSGNSGNELVRSPLPVYPHMKTIQSEAEGMEVATTLGDGRAVLLRGHGAVTVGNNVSQSVMAMAQLEEQAQVNYYAYCAEGADHTHLSEAEMSEVTNRVPIWELPHFREVLRGRERQRDGVWAYHEMLATTELFDT
jgi:L-fuculose-phosphate aldolase